MANLSSAAGTLTVTSSNKEALLDFLTEYNKWNQQAYYSILLDNDITIDNIEKLPHTDDYQFVSDFTGTGRWNIESNINWTFSQTPKTDLWNKQLITVDFEGVDTEPGCDFIVCFDATVEWDPVTQTDSIVYNNTSTFDYTVSNLAEVGMASDGMVDTEYILTDLTGTNIFHFAKEIKDLVKASPNEYPMLAARLAQTSNEPIREIVALLEPINFISVYYSLDEYLMDIEDYLQDQISV